MEGQIVLSMVLNDDETNKTELRMMHNRQILLVESHYGSSPTIIPLDRAVLEKFLNHLPDAVSNIPQASVATGSFAPAVNPQRNLAGAGARPGRR